MRAKLLPLQVGIIVDLIAIVGLLLLRSSAAAANADWNTYENPFWAFRLSYPSGWNLQNSPYRDFGFRISSPDLQTDPMGRPLRGAYLAISVSQMTETEKERYLQDTYRGMKIESRAPISIGEQALANGQTALAFQEAGLSDPQGEPAPVGALMGAAVSVGVSAMYLPLVLR